MDPKIDAYIRENREKYTGEAIRDQLIASGHDPAAVDEAIQRLGLAAPAAPETAARPRVAGMSALVAFGWLLFIVGGITGLLGMAMASSFGSNGSLPIFLIGYVGIGLAIALLLQWAVPRFRIGGVWAALLGVALIPVFAGLMLGICVAAFAASRG